MKKVCFLLFLVAFTACKQAIPAEDLKKLNGYWEIERVEMPDGTEKTYGMNESYDYFQLQSGRGTRVKVMPQLDGTYRSNGLGELVKVIRKDGETILNYQTAYSKWSETLVELEDSLFVARNTEGKVYHYKRATPLNLLENGQKTK